MLHEPILNRRLLGTEPIQILVQVLLVACLEAEDITDGVHPG
jgi:hypothetical protein